MSAVLDTILERALFEPMRDLLGRPGKNIRADLVESGFLLGSPQSTLTPLVRERCAKLARALEAIHAGSLVVDDIQDGSKERRGHPSLHESYGVPLALNTGNALYFQPFTWIRELELDEHTELSLYRLFHEAMLKAHLGQAIDLGAKIERASRESVPDICLQSLQLKTGALTALAITSGAALAQASDQEIERLREFGMRFGVALQMFDDIGNLSLPLSNPKRFEDFRLLRPTWIWASVASNASDSDYSDFLAAVRELPNEANLLAWLKRFQSVERARAEAELYLVETKLSLGLSVSKIDSLFERIRTSYG